MKFSDTVKQINSKLVEVELKILNNKYIDCLENINSTENQKVRFEEDIKELERKL